MRKLILTLLVLSVSVFAAGACGSEDEAAFFASGGNAGNFRTSAALVAAEDEDAALEAVEKTGEGKISRSTYKDVEYMTDESEEAAAVFDGYVVLGTEAGVKAVIDAKEDGEKLSDLEG